ncbi:nucleotide exchange factor GrpE [Serpentinicella alkaliphila]|uniref:Protein GrpE n=1 Tax=Serpentinicella alkaliphila TaxID=1734049 RepID=A0A4R2TVX0_9FIRM|nr:nucleotide exchange factor GrpE [Serpentinicella alkaliphila]QUH26916.1 nucleotide exchange factor GrpE [Serpentinicella alkaliphila]TCQ08150.1 molecular chaperone GrpE [Serpentinicella alkaliphila]
MFEENIKEDNQISVEEMDADSNLEAFQEEMKDQQEAESIENLKNLLKEKELESIDFQNRHQRLQADFINYKKRVEKEKSEIYQYGVEKLAIDLLNIIDGLERALDSQKDTTNSFTEGIQLILKQFLDILDKHGIKEIEALNKPFDLNLHHAVMKEESDVESNTVIEVYQKGYTIHSKVLRPAMVKVSA